MKLHSLRQILVFHLLLTAIYQTGIPSSNPRQSHRVHPVHATEKPHTPAGHRRPEEAECPAGTTRWVSLCYSWLLLAVCYLVMVVCVLKEKPNLAVVAKMKECVVLSLYFPVRALEKVKGTTQLQANYSSSDSSLYTNPKGSAVSAFDGGSDSSSESEPEEQRSRKKHRGEDS